MRITRFINGKKVHKPFSEELIIENETISGTIEKINSRILKKKSAERRDNE